MNDTKETIRRARAYRERLLGDPYRPGYHFAVPDDDGRPGDPNGYFCAGGRHHLMYLYRRDGGAFHWGHVSSIDLVHWRHHPDALVKGPLDDGAFSGGAFVDADGSVYLSYWIFNAEYPRDKQTPTGIALAKGAPPDYDEWRVLPGYGIPSDEWGIKNLPDGQGGTTPLGCADPSNIWKRDGLYYMQTGNLLVLNKYGRAADSPKEMRGDWTELFASEDLRVWQYRGRFYQRRADNAWTDESEDDMCPCFLPLPGDKAGGAPSGKWLQLFIAHNKGTQYYIGDYAGERFYPQKHGRFSWVDNAYFAPEAALDDQGRLIAFAWLLDNAKDDFERFGWSGVYGLPRVLWLGEDGELRQAPAQEIEALRYHPQSFAARTIEDACEVLEVRGAASCEVRLTAELAAGAKAGLIVNGARLYCDSAAGELVFDSRTASKEGWPALERAPFVLAPNEPLRLTVFADKSVLEVYANERQAICRRVYTDEKPSIQLFAEGAARFAEIGAWEMMPALPY